MADDRHQEAPRRTRRTSPRNGARRDASSRTEDFRNEDSRAEGGNTHTDGSPQRAGRRRRISAEDAARRAATEVAELTGREPESVISIERSEETWIIGIEVVETRRIPDSADVLATYEVKLEPDGKLLAYHRVRRYARGQLDRD